jgi:hypothetical protein
VTITLIPSTTWEAINDALDVLSAVPDHDVATLPDSPGLYSIWGEDLQDLDQPMRLLYVGMSDSLKVGVRRRVLGHLHRPGCDKKRPNETLLRYVLDVLVRPNMQEDDRTCVEIALAYLREYCLFAGWAWDGESSLGVLERIAQRDGISDEIPMLNNPNKS